MNLSSLCGKNEYTDTKTVGTAKIGATRRASQKTPTTAKGNATSNALGSAFPKYHHQGDTPYSPDLWRNVLNQKTEPSGQNAPVGPGQCGDRLRVRVSSGSGKATPEILSLARGAQNAASAAMVSTSAATTLLPPKVTACFIDRLFVIIMCTPTGAKSKATSHRNTTQTSVRRNTARRFLFRTFSIFQSSSPARTSAGFVQD
mmetsp:Transcript_4809/g.16053  ORF Transcript_4809/g.16053 Transcript_4809/m.16053 type:complete len:202 (-) Transcript_4809:563-1168(-)